MTVASTSDASAKVAAASYVAGGTDVMDRCRHGLLSGPFRDVHAPSGIETGTDADGGLVVGAGTPIAALAAIGSYRGLAQAAAHLATPQIRRQGTVGGNLLQSSRCRYFRHPHLPCTHKGDPECGSREGYDDNAVLFDPGGRGCVHPHPSTLAMALMAYDAEAETDGTRRPVADLYDPLDRTRTHVLGSDERLERVHVPPAPDGERAAYLRVSARKLAEWALVECCVRLALDGERIARAAVAVGAVAPVPLRLPAVEAALVGERADEAAFARAAALASEGANPVPAARYKLRMLPAAVKQALLDAR